MDAEQQKANKVPVWKHWRFFPRAMLEVAKVMEFDSSKPGRKAGGWAEDSDVSETYFYDPLLRHMIDSEINGPKKASESELLHLARRACNAMMVLEMELRKHEQTRSKVLKMEGGQAACEAANKSLARAQSDHLEDGYPHSLFDLRSGGV